MRADVLELLYRRASPAARMLMHARIAERYGAAFAAALRDLVAADESESPRHRQPIRCDAGHSPPPVLPEGRRQFSVQEPARDG
jgi:hypothetical protein